MAEKRTGYRMADMPLSVQTLLRTDKTSGRSILLEAGASSEEAAWPWWEEAAIVTESGQVIRPRAQKGARERADRTRRHAEVFTPGWVCCLMNDLLDEMWFGRKGAFCRLTGRDWEPVKGKIRFPAGKNWRKYVDARRLEITCGEAPFLAFCYDASTGEHLPVRRRMGLLDRKLRVVGENTKSEAEWLKWATRAVESVYGYEYQGDSLLLARANLLFTFAEHLRERWNREPTEGELKKIANIIAWNLWQMDGRTLARPEAGAEALGQLDLFPEGEKPTGCRIYNWRSRRTVTYGQLRRCEGRGAYFDGAVGNPPYQDETSGENRGFAPPVYHLFLQEAYRVARCAVIIHPARCLFGAGSTPKDWNRRMAEDEHLRVAWYEAGSQQIFPGTDIKGGVAVTCRDRTKRLGPIGVFTPYPEMRSILKKVAGRRDFSGMDGLAVTRTACRLTRAMHADHPEALGQLSRGHAYDMSTNIFSRLPQIFFDRQPEEGGPYIRILGREGNRRLYKYVKESYVNRVCNLDRYKIFLPKANGSGAFGETLTEPVVAGPGVGATETFISIGAFSTEGEARAALKYLSTRFARALLGVLKTTQDLTPEKWRYVPVQDFSDHSDLDWTAPVEDLDAQLCRKYRLSPGEQRFLKARVERMKEEP